jgi:hypothetical protein
MELNAGSVFSYLALTACDNTTFVVFAFGNFGIDGCTVC